MELVGLVGLAMLISAPSILFGAIALERGVWPAVLVVALSLASTAWIVAAINLVVR